MNSLRKKRNFACRFFTNVYPKFCSVVLAVFLMHAELVHAGCIWATTGASTSWTNPAAWTSVYSGSGSGCVGSYPSASSIGPGDVVNLNHSMTLTTAKLTVQSGGVLNVNCCTFTVNGNIEFANGSYIMVSPSAWLKIQGNMVNNNNSTNVNLNGVVTVSGNLTAGNGSAINSPMGSGSLTVSGGIVTDGTATIFGQNLDCPDSLTPCSVNSSIVLLPVEMLSTSVQCENNGVKVSWVTASEQMSDYFSVERSIDGSNWEVIGVVQAAGNSNERIEYAYIDELRTFQITYYRLKQFDQDGDVELYDLGTVDCKDEAKDDLSVFPNPCQGEINIRFLAKEIIGNSTVRVMDSNSTSVIVGQYDVQSGLNQFYFDTNKLFSGIYYVQILNDARSSDTYKFVVLH